MFHGKIHGSLWISLGWFDVHNLYSGLAIVAPPIQETPSPEKKEKTENAFKTTVANVAIIR